ncbi:4-(cytidine 5'-diphospho)-2-C-methyl-D-erythritol kinase [Nocardioides sp. URHA0020]|uniref:4-(cytidine 5'-diphospho)-2-C-methyl-D-erythritol kinase n=1 Tax=Nocardioides sp. URHA0020 TaxID=1380392 RepID=UPI00048B3858|nr:4-(cytidine 5'-diphospho)-2-C-methyl-D-erythritol kinase [Nocardioides sp. URHA0020]
MTPGTTLTVRAPAKINLHLGVGAPREDGFHPLTSVYQAVGVYDDLTVADADGWSVDVTVSDWMDRSQVPLAGDNIVDRAATLLAAHHGLTVSGEAHIDKAIPVAGGMAGGSADAAAALVALDRLWEANTSDDDLLALAAQLGSDVPFALVGGTALGTGRGEIVEPVPDAGTWWWVLVPSATGLSTPEIYRHFDRLFPDAPVVPPMPEPLLAALAAGDARALAAALHNDLQPAALDLRPDLARLIDAGEAAGALRGVVTGSGPTCVFLCESADQARETAAELQAAHDVVLVTTGAVAGAHTVSYV